MLILIFTNICIGLTAFLIVKNLYAESKIPDKVLIWFLFFLAQIIIVGLILGVLNRFYLLNAAICHLLILSGAFLLAKKRNIFHFYKVDIAFIFNNKLLLFACSVFIAFFCVKTFLNLITPPICADSLQYHLAFPATWIRNGNINNPFCMFGAVKGVLDLELSSITYYPINAQLFFAWLMLPLRNAFLADIGQAPFYIIGILSIYSILRKYSVDKNTAFFSGLLWVLIPNLFKQIKYGSQIDVICAVLFLIVFNNLLLLKDRLNFKNVLIFGISLGIFIGTKLLNIIWAAALIPIFSYYLMQKYNTASRLGILPVVLTISSTILLFGSYVYLKNFVHTGNPFFPVQIKILGRLIFPGVIDNHSYSTAILGKYAHGVFDVLFREGLGVQFITFVLPGTIMPLVLYLRFKERFKPAWEYILFFCIPLLMLSLYYLFIHAQWTRYIFPYLGMGLIVFVVFLDRLNLGEKYITIFGFIAVVSSAFELAHRNELIISVFISLILFILFLVGKNKILNFYKYAFNFRALFIILIFTGSVLTFLNIRYNKEEFTRYPYIFNKKESWQRDIGYAWAWLDKNAAGGKRVAYVGRTEIYPLFGSGLKNDVIYVPVNKKSVLPYDFTDGLYRKEKNFQDWLDNIKFLKIDFLYIALPQVDNRESDDPNEFPIEDRWAAAHPQLFRQVFKNSLVHIYQVSY